MNPSVIVLGYGNTLRGDDAAGREVATQLERLAHPALDIRSCHQLTPELAEPIARCQLALFIDASILPNPSPTPSPPPTCTPIAPGPSHTNAIAHSCSPESLLNLALNLYGHAPAAWLIHVPATSFNLGAPLTPACAQAVAAAVNLALHLVAAHAPEQK